MPLHMLTSSTLGIDLGTSSCKASLIDSKGKLLASATAHYPTHSPKPGYAEQDPADWLTAAGHAVREILKKAPSKAITGIALTSAAHIAVLLDKNDLPLRRAILWSDQRSAPQAAELNQSHGKLILRQSFQAASTSWTLPHLAWLLKHEPNAISKTRSILLSKDYLFFKLTGQKLTDPGTAVSSQLYDARKNSWSIDLCALVNITPSMLPAVLPANSQGGTLTPEGAALLGLTRGIPVILGTLDSATELLAAGISQPGQGMVRMASAGGLQRVVAKPTPSTTRITYPHPVTPHWYTQSCTTACATSVAWGKETLSPQSEYKTWDKQAAAIPPGAEGLFFHPYLAGERAPLWNPNLRASFLGLTARHTQAHMARAIYEGTAFSIRHAMPSEPLNPAPLAAVGGGAKSALWLKILASVLNHPLRVVPDADSSLGAALIALSTLGGTQTLTALAHSRATTGSIIAPDPTWAATYEKHFHVYKSLSAALTEIHRL
jgi:xylulokinase